MAKYNKYNQLRPLAFSMNLEAVVSQPEFTAYPFWTLGLPGDLKQDLLKALAKATNRPLAKVHLPVQILNSAARMLIPNLIAIEQYAGRTNTHSWLYGFIGPDGEQPASPDAILLLVQAWIQTAFPKIQPATLRSIVQQLTARSFQWKRETMDLTHWNYAKNGTATPYEKNSNRSGFMLWPDLIAARLAQAELEWGHHILKFKRVPTSPGQHGVELVSWPPLEEHENDCVWPYSVLLTFTLQTVPFQSFPVLYCSVGIRRWAGPQVYLPGKIETSVYLLDQVPWIQGLPNNQCFQVAPIRWVSVPENKETGDKGGSRLGWGSNLIPLLNELHIGKNVFPDPQVLANNPYSFLQSAQMSSQPPVPTAAIVYREGLKPAHEAGIGFMPRDRSYFAEKIAAILQPEFAFIPPYERRTYELLPVFNPFFEEKKKVKKPPTEAEVLQAKNRATTERLKSVHAAVPSLKIIIRYQSKEVHIALRNAIEDLLGSPDSQRAFFTIESQPLGALGEKLSVKAGSPVTLYDRQREAISQRAADIAAQLTPAAGDIGVLIELDNEDGFDDGYDPKPALRIGFGRKGYHTQFITPQSAEVKSAKKSKDQIDTQLKERARAAVRDLLRQFGVIGSLPAIQSKLNKKQENLLNIPAPLHYLGAWLIKSTKASPTHIAQEIPVLVHMASNSWGIEVLAPGWDDWLSYRKAQLTLLTQPAVKVFKPEEITQFLLETLDSCLPNFGDTILFCHAQNLRSTWKWLGNELITKALPEELKQHDRLRIVRLRTGEPETPEWYAQKGLDEFGFASGIFEMGFGGQVFAGLQKKPLTMKELSVGASKALPQKKVDKKTQEEKVFDPRPDVRAWNPGICEFTISCSRPEDALMCAVVTNELRDHFAAHFRSPTVYPIPLHLASLLNPYVLPLNKPLRGTQNEADEEE